MAYATFCTFFMTHFTSPYGHISTQCSDVEIQVETTSQGNSSRVTKALATHMPVQKGQLH